MDETKIICQKCGDDITTSKKNMIDGHCYCLGCYSDEVINSNQNNVKETHNSPSLYQNKYAGTLGAFAIIELISSIVLAIYIWAKYGTIEITSGYFYSFTETEINPLGIGLGFGILIQGIVIYVILSALKVMAEDIADIKNLSGKAKE